MPGHKNTDTCEMMAEELVARLMEGATQANLISNAFDDAPLGNATPAEAEAMATSQKAWDALFADIQALANRAGRIPLPRKRG